MIFAIHAYEDRYGGYHGMEDWGFMEAENETDDFLIETAETMCSSLISSYGLEDEYFDDFEEDLDEEAMDDIIREHYAWDIIPLPKATSVEALEREYSDDNDPEGIIERYR